MDATIGINLGNAPTDGVPERIRPDPFGNASGDMVSLVKVQPVYPAAARSRDIEGYVIVEFTVTAGGTVENARVLRSEPTGIFDKAALTAAYRFKFRPRLLEGKPVAVSGVQNKFTFQLED